MANYYYPMYIPVNRDSRSSRERKVQECIDENSDWESKQLTNQEFTAEEVQAIQTCADDKESTEATIMGPVVIGVLIFFVVMIGLIIHDS